MLSYIFFGIFAAAGLAIWFWPVETHTLVSKKSPVLNYADSVRLIEGLRQSDPPEVADYGHLLFLSHGCRTKKCVLMYHGYTNCPRQYEKLARMFFERGYNVYVPRIPYHGIGDLVTSKIKNLSIEDITTVCDSAVDIARGLGEHVTVLGLSMGGVMAAWNVQFRDDIDQAVIIVPSFGWFFLPGILRPLINLSFLMPNMLLWWDPVRRDKRQAPYSMYHRFSTHGMAHILRLGLAVMRGAKKHAPGVARIIMMTNEADIAVDDLNTKRLVRFWQGNGARVDFYRFSKTLKMEHDVIDPLHPYERTDFVYAEIFEYLEKNSREGDG